MNFFSVPFLLAVTKKYDCIYYEVKKRDNALPGFKEVTYLKFSVGCLAGEKYLIYISIIVIHLTNTF